jgi:cytidylate kinase
MRGLIIAIDGPVGSGKSTVARRVAELLGYTYLDSGAMYRALGWKALERGAPLDSPEQLEALARETRIDFEQSENGLRVLLDGTDVTAEIRSGETSQAASKVAMMPGVRRVLVAEQRRAGQAGGIVMEGRDIGTVVFPDADLKIYLDAAPEVRAERRWREHQSLGERVELAQMVEEVRLRDERDTQRGASPLVRTADAVFVDSTALEAEEVARLMVMLAGEKERK